jgi:hypothetical protein
MQMGPGSAGPGSEFLDLLMCPLSQVVRRRRRRRLLTPSTPAPQPTQHSLTQQLEEKPMSRFSSLQRAFSGLLARSEGLSVHTQFGAATATAAQQRGFADSAAEVRRPSQYLGSHGIDVGN